VKDDYSNLISNIFWGNVRVLVNKTGLQDKEFERKAGIKKSVYTNGKNYKYCPSIVIALKIAKILGVTVDFLLTEQKDVLTENTFTEYLLTKEEIEYVELWRKLSPEIKSLNKKQLSVTVEYEEHKKEEQKQKKS